MNKWGTCANPTPDAKLFESLIKITAISTSRKNHDLLPSTLIKYSLTNEIWNFKQIALKFNIKSEHKESV